MKIIESFTNTLSHVLRSVAMYGEMAFTRKHNFSSFFPYPFLVLFGPYRTLLFSQQQLLAASIVGFWLFFLLEEVFFYG